MLCLNYYYSNSLIVYWYDHYYIQALLLCQYYFIKQFNFVSSSHTYFDKSIYKPSPMLSVNSISHAGSCRPLSLAQSLESILKSSSVKRNFFPSIEPQKKLHSVNPDITHVLCTVIFGWLLSVHLNFTVVQTMSLLLPIGHCIL